MKPEISYNDILNNMKTHLEVQGIEYIRNIRKEVGALNKFMMDQISPHDVMILLGKLITVKRNPKLSKDSFWQGCIINLHDLYSYKEKIENIYSQLCSKTDKPVVAKVEELKERTWDSFLEWSKKTGCSDDTLEFFKGLNVTIKGHCIEVDSDVEFTGMRQPIIEGYFRMPIVIKGPVDGIN